MWRGERGFGPFVLAGLTAPMAVAFGSAVRVRNTLYDRGILRQTAAALPVMSIGNLAAGGTGKTPISAWLARELLSSGFRPALVLRGVGEDEILLHRRWNPEVPVIRARQRSEGAATALAMGLDVVVLDDGFQHRRLRRDVDLVLLSPDQPFPPRLLPRGPFREPLRALRRADRILVTAKGRAGLAAARSLAQEVERLRGIPPVSIFPMRPGRWTALDGSPAPPPEGSPVLVTSVAEPEGFRRLVEEAKGAALEHLAFPDHHAFNERDASRVARAAGTGWIATTEKDAVKLLPFLELLPEVRVLPLVPDPPSDLGPEIVSRLRAIVGAREAATS